VNLDLPTACLERYKSASQRARIGTESWGLANFFCPACESPRLRPAAQGTAAIDYYCPTCNSPFQLKSQSKPIGTRVADSAYSEMKRAILEDRTPNFFIMHYDLDNWAVKTVVLVPHFAFSLSAVERRKPLAPTARRAGWVGCNILMDKIPSRARISIVSDGAPHTQREVRNSYNRLRPLEKLRVEKRGWTLDVLQAIQQIGMFEFTLADVYAHAGTVAKLHPNNRHVRDKIRQQLQVLRDLGLLHFLGAGSYRLG
jgi:type II restriction enzyme